MLTQEVQQQRVDRLGGLQLHPVPDAVETLIAPRAGDMGRRARHRLLGQARSPLLQIPMAGACTGGSSGGGWISDVGGRIARYRLRLAASASGSARRSTTAWMSGCRDHDRRFRKPSAPSHRSATPGNWNRSMYHDFARWAHPAVRKAVGWPTDSAVREATRSGTRAAVIQEIGAPQSWPTRWARGIDSWSSTPITSPTRCAMSYAWKPAGRLESPNPRRSGA